MIDSATDLAHVTIYPDTFTQRFPSFHTSYCVLKALLLHRAHTWSSLLNLAFQLFFLCSVSVSSYICSILIIGLLCSATRNSTRPVRYSGGGGEKHLAAAAADLHEQGPIISSTSRANENVGKESKLRAGARKSAPSVLAAAGRNQAEFLIRVPCRKSGK